jgi:CHAT domain-containing protein/Flp pilus assembly protein TadD
MGQTQDYEILIRELLVGIAGGWNYGNVIVLLMTKNVDEENLALWLKEFAEGLSLDRDWELVEQLKLLGKMTPGRLASEALLVVTRLDSSYEPNSELLNFNAWQSQSLKLLEQGRYKEAIANLENAIQIKPDDYESWNNLGGALENSVRYEEAIASYNRAIEIKYDHYQSWYNRGNTLFKMGRSDEAIESCDRAIYIQPNFWDAWRLRIDSLNNLRKYEDALESCERIIRINPEDCDIVRFLILQSVALANLNQWERAVESCEKAINIQSDYAGAWVQEGIVLCDFFHEYEKALESFDHAIKIQIRTDDRDIWATWNNRGVALVNLERYEEALESLDNAISFKSDESETWSKRGYALYRLARYEQAITSYDRALEFDPADFGAWHGRSSAIGILNGYDAKIDAYDKAFQYIYLNEHPEGWGYLQDNIGYAHYKEGQNQLFNPDLKWQLYDHALTSYRKAIQILTRKAFPKLRLETLIDTAQVYLAQNNTSAARQCQTEALDIWQELISAHPHPQGKKRLYFQYSHLLSTEVDLSILRSEPVHALEIAEFHKNKYLEWLLCGQVQQGRAASLILTEIEQLRIDVMNLQYSQMRQLLLTPNTAIIYWHLSHDNLTTFILKAENTQLLVCESDRRTQAQQIVKWIEEWDTQYCDYGSKKALATQFNQNDKAAAEAKEQHPWRQNMPSALSQLRQILEIDQICAQLPSALTHLILIPHRDLHRFPLHTLFLTSAKLEKLQGCTYLPSIQVGLNLQNRPSSRSYTPLLSVEDPQIDGIQPMIFAQIESAIVRYLFQPHIHINSASANLATIENALSQSPTSFHFTGHAAYNSRSPEASALVLTDKPLTAKRISQLDLSSYNLITLAACETAITGKENIDTEYVGLTSAFLQAGAANVLSTLWQVDEIANAWFTIYFYQQLLAGKSPTVSLALTQKWMQILTWQELVDWLTQLSQLPHLGIGIIDRLKAHITNMPKRAGIICLNKPTEYSHPYYWAAFTLTGEG